MSAAGVVRGVAQWLNGSSHRGERVATGKRDGVPVEVRLALRGTGYERTSVERRWTEIDVQLPPGYPLSIYVRRHDWTDHHQLEARTMVDIELGDPDFDRQFLIEAAPAQIARRLLAPPLRHLLARYDAITLTTESLDGRAVLRLATATWLALDPITTAVDALVALSGDVRDAYAALEASALRGDGSPYRPSLDAAHGDAQRAALAAEVDDIARLRGNR